eukprot:SAG11_NODE_1186_length_5590_cov_2.852850_8_plen_191_part_00
MCFGFSRLVPRLSISLAGELSWFLPPSSSVPRPKLIRNTEPTPRCCRARCGSDQQVFALCGESYYFVISVDLFLNLRSSPFSHTKTRVKFYHIFVLSTGLVMAIFLAVSAARRTRTTQRQCAQRAARSTLIWTVCARGRCLKRTSALGWWKQNGNWGPSTVLLRHVCWNKNFGVTSATEGLASGWTFMYT